MPVAQRWRHPAGQPLPHVGQRRVDRHHHRIRLRRRGQVDGRLGQRDPGLRQADQLDDLRGGHAHRQRGRVGHPDIFGGVDHQPAGDEPRILTGLDHPGQIVHGRVDVTAADRLRARK
jgi:hypothetical protein